jgi:hypothetical protein
MNDKEFQDQLKIIYDKALVKDDLVVALNILLMRRNDIKNKGSKIV